MSIETEGLHKEVLEEQNNNEDKEVQSSIGELPTPEKTEREEVLETELNDLLRDFKRVEDDLIGKNGMIKSGEKRQDIPLLDDNGKPQIGEDDKIVRGFSEDKYRGLLAKRNELWNKIVDLEDKRFAEQTRTNKGMAVMSDKLSREIESFHGLPVDILKAENWENGEDHSDYEGHGGTDTLGAPANTYEYYKDQGYEMTKSRGNELFVRKLSTN